MFVNHGSVEYYHVLAKYMNDKISCYVNPIRLKWWDPAKDLPQRSCFYMNYTTHKMKIDIVDGWYICMALETSDNV